MGMMSKEDRRRMSALMSTASDPALGKEFGPEAAFGEKLSAKIDGRTAHAEATGLEMPPVGRTGKPKTKVHATTVEEFRMRELIEPVIAKQPDGCWKYNEGWSDHRIATMIGREGITSNHVARIRGMFFGHLIKTAPPPQKSTLEKRVEHLEQMFNALAVEIGSNARIASPAPAPWPGSWTPPKE